MAFSKSNYPYLGFPGLTYNELISYGSHGMTYEEKKTRLGKILAFIRAFIVMREDKVNEEKIEKLVSEISADLDRLEDIYDPNFEELAVYSPGEKQFCKACRSIFEKQTEIISYAKMIDKIREAPSAPPTGDE